MRTGICITLKPGDRRRLAALARDRNADVPGALSVEWQGQQPCEKLFEDAQVRTARCTFPPGAVHAGGGPLRLR